MSPLTFILFLLLSTVTINASQSVNDVLFNVDEAEGIKMLSCNSQMIVATFESFVAVQSVRLKILPGLSQGSLVITGTNLTNCLHGPENHERSPIRARRNVERIETSALAIRFFLVAVAAPRRGLSIPWWAPHNPASPTAPPSQQSDRIRSLACPFYTSSNGKIRCTISARTLPQCFLHSTLFHSSTTDVGNFETTLLAGFCGNVMPCQYFFVKNETLSATMMFLCSITAQTPQPTQAPTTAPTNTTTSAPSSVPSHTPSTSPTTYPTSAPTIPPPTSAPSANPSVSPSVSPSVVPTVQPTDEPTMALDWSRTFMFMNITIGNTTILPAVVRFRKPLQKAAEQSLYYATRTVSLTLKVQPPNVNDIQILLEKVDDRPLVSRRRQLLQQTMKLTFRIGAQKRLFLDFIISFPTQISREFASNLAREWDDSKITIGTVDLSAIITKFSATPKQTPSFWWEHEFVTVELLVVLFFIPVVGLIVLAGLLYECVCGKAKVTPGDTIDGEDRDEYRAINIIKFGFLTFNTITDMAFAWSLFGQNQLMLFGLSLFFIVIPFVGSLYAWLRTKRQFRDDLYFEAWEQRFDMPFIILSILCGSTFGAFLLVHSQLFQLEIFSMGLTLDQRLYFLSQRLVYTVLIEDIPQFAIQIASVVLVTGKTLRERLTGITFAAFFASTISIIVGIYNAVNKSEQLKHSLTMQSVTTTEMKQVEFVGTTSPKSNEGETMTGQTVEGEDRAP